MPSQLCCDKRMDRSGPSLAFSSPNYELAELINPLFLEDPRFAGRLPLPPGHPLSWGPLTLGTVLEGSAFADSL